MQTEMTIRNLKTEITGEITKDTAFTVRLGRLFNEFQVPGRTHSIEDDSTDVDFRRVLFKTLDHGSDTLSSGSGIDNEHHRKVKDRGQGGRTGIAAIKETHDPFHHRNVFSCHTVTEQVSAKGFSTHPEIQVGRDKARDHFMEAGVDKVRATLERLDLQAPGFESGHNAKGQGGLPGTAGGSTYEKSR